MPWYKTHVAVAVVSAAWSFAKPVPACDAPKCTCQCVGEPVQSRHGGWWIATTENFQVCSLAGATESIVVAKRCESLRASLIDHWALVNSACRWRPRCQVILHPSERSYCAAVGFAGAATWGSSLVVPTTGTIRSRRIDLRADVADYQTAALPHELSHILVADRFRERAPPLWYDEGIALLSDTEEKQRLHERDRREGVRNGLAFTVSQVVTLESYPSGERMGVFYGQCAALARFLRGCGTADQLHQFAAQCREIGVDRAATESYGFSDGRDLQQQWLGSLATDARWKASSELGVCSSQLRLANLQTDAGNATARTLLVGGMATRQPVARPLP